MIGCTARGNINHGINAEGDPTDGLSGGLVKDNECSFNGGAGIRVTGNGTRVEGNNCFSNGWGIQSPARNKAFIVRNSCRGSSEPPTNDPPATSNYDFDRATNTYGPVITVNGDMSDNPATSHPGANIRY